MNLFTSETFLKLHEYCRSLTEKQKEQIPKDLLTFVVDTHKKLCLNDFIVKPFHEELCFLLQQAAERKLRENIIIINMPPRFSKAIDCTTPMFTPNGWIAAERIQIGDKLLGSNGLWTTVTGTYPQGIKPCYDVTFSDGTSLLACDEHLWQVKLRGKKKNIAPWRVMQTKELIGDLREADGRKKWRIPVLEDKNNQDRELPIDPYLFGYWLGNGYSNGCGVTTLDKEVVDAFKDFDPKPYKHQSSGKATSYGLRKGFVTRIKALNVLNNKHIPDIYMYASHTQRLSLLQGLADSYGTVSKITVNQSISCSDKRLAIDIKKLICGLGGVYRDYYYQPKNGKLANTISFMVGKNDIAFRLQRKKEKINKRSEKNLPRRFIDSIEYVDEREMICFSVDSEDHLFCAGKDFIVTHNTQILSYHIQYSYLKNPSAQYIYASYSKPLAIKQSREIKDALIKIHGVESHISKNAAEVWETKQHGAFLATSVYGQFTGFGAGDMAGTPYSGEVIIDDAQKPVDCFYETKRNTLIENFSQTIWSRRNNVDKIPIIVCQQRLHPDDLSGYLINKSNYKVKVFKLAALDESGQSTFPERASTESILELKATNEFTFYAQQMQEPKAYSGNYFRVDATELISYEDFKKCKIKFYVRSWDFAGVRRGQKITEKADWTRGVLMCTDGEFVYILHVAGHKKTVEQNDNLVTDCAQSDGPYTQVTIPIDPGVAGQRYVDYLQHLPELRGVTLHPMPTNQNKMLRAAPFASFLNRGKVKIVSDDTDIDKWNLDLLGELASFPHGTHDDIVDACSDAFTLIHEIKGYI